MATKKKPKTALELFGKEMGLLSAEETRKANMEQSIQNARERTPAIMKKRNYEEAKRINREQKYKAQKYKTKVEQEKEKLGLNSYKPKVYTGVKEQQDYLKTQMQKKQQNNSTELKPFSLYDKGMSTKEEKDELKQHKQKLDKYYNTSNTYKKYKEEMNKWAFTEYAKDVAQVNSEKVTKKDKFNILRPFLSTLEDPFRTKDFELENGSKVALPSYNDLKEQQVMSEMGKIGKAVHGASESFGSMAPSLAVSAIPGAGRFLSPAVTLATTADRAKNEKLIEGYSEKEATNYALINGTLEAGLQYALGGITKLAGGKQGLLQRNIDKVLNKAIANPGGRRLLSSLSSEMVEEEVQNLLDPINEHLTLGKYNSLSEALSQWDWDEATVTALSTILTVGLTEGRTAFNVSKLNKQVKQLNQEYGTDLKVNTDGIVMNDNGKQMTNEQVGQMIDKAKKEKLEKEKISQIQEKQLVDIENRQQQLSVDYQSGNISEEQYTKEIGRLSDELKMFTEEQNNKEINPITKIEADQEILQDRLNNGEITEKQYNSEMDKLNTKLREISGKPERYQYTPGESESINKLEESASKYFDNSEKSRNYIEMLKKISTDKGLSIVFDDSIGDNINGQYQNGAITINPNSNRAGEFIAIHELTHAIGTEQMKSIIETYRQSNAEFDQAVKSLMENYDASEINEEAMADVAGQLFGNQEFINNIAETNPSLFKRIYQEIKYLYHQFRGYKNQDQFIEDLQYKWEQAYRNNKVKIDESTNYSIEKNSNLKYNTIDEAIEDDIRKEPYKKYNTSIDLFNLNIKEMQEVIAKGSYYAQLAKIEGNNSGVYSVNLESGYYDAYFDLINKENDNNEFGITHFIPIDEGVENDYDNTKETDSYIETYIGRQQGFNSRYSESAENGTTTRTNDDIYSKQPQRQEFNEKGQIVEKNIGNSKELDNSSFSNETKYSKNTEGMNDYLNKNLSTKDNSGRKLSKRQQEYFKDSKVRDENGNLEVVYHGSKKSGFTTFSTKDNVNFYTNNSNVANTYSGSNEKVDTRKLESVNDAKSWLKGIDEYSYINGNTVYDYDGNVMLKYNTEEEMLKHLKRDIQIELGDTEAGGIYEGYVNITNPYIFDADNKNWNNLTIGINDDVEKMYKSLNNQEKEYLSDLAEKMDTEYDNYKDGLEGFYQRLNANNESLYDKVTIETSIREKLYDTALYNWNDTYVEDLIGKRYSTNDIVKQVVETNKNGNNYDGIIFKNIIDEGMFDSGTKNQTVSNVYVTFNSNQFKAVDNTNPTKDADIRYSKDTEGMKNFLERNMSKEQNTQDSEGNKLSENQRNYFKNSKVRDAEGNLEVVYHGTPNDFTVFDISKSNDVAKGNGLYFTNVRSTADAYANNSETSGKTLEGYLDIRNPINSEEKSITFDDFKKLYKALDSNKNLYDEEMGMSEIKSLLTDYGDVYNEDIDSVLRKYYESYEDDVALIDNLSYVNNVSELYKTIRNTIGVDGIIVDNPSSFAPYEKYYIAFNSNQFKNIDNINPTTNDDIRHSKNIKNWTNYLEKNFKPKGTTTKFADIMQKRVEKKTADQSAFVDVGLNEVSPTATVFHGQKVEDLKNWVKNPYLAWGEKRAVKDKLTETKDKLDFDDTLTQEQRKQLNKEEAQLAFALDYDNYKQRVQEYQQSQNQKAMKEMTKQVKDTITPVKHSMESLTKEIEEIRETLNLPKRKIMNPAEIAKLTKADASTTTKLADKKVSTGKGESSFANNILNKTDMLTDFSKEKILSELGTKYYKQVTNEDSMSKALDRLEEGGASETLNWFQKASDNADSTDVAEGWILMKQYQDTGDYDGMVQVAKKMREIGTKAGQTVQAFNIMERLTPEGMVKYAQSELSEAYDQMIKNKTKAWIDEHRMDFELTGQEVQFILDTMNEVSTMEDGYDKKVKLAEIQKIMTDKLPADKNNAIKSWMRISMLFNPKTQVRNVVGNAIIAPVNYASDIFASAVDKAISKKTNVRTTGTINVQAVLKGFKEGAYQATNDYKKGINTKDMEGNRFEIGEGKTFSDKTLIGKSLNRVDSLLNYVMDAGDRIFSQSSFENSLQNQMILNNTTEVTQDMIDIARNESLSRTWNDNNNYTRFVLNVRKMMNTMKIGGYGVGDILIPFAKTPANLTKAIVDYSPAGLINTLTQGKNLKRSIENGQYTPQMQHQFVQSLGKATAGTMLYVLGYALAKSGVISGESDDDKDTANFLKNTLGVNSYSIKIGGKSFTYDWAQPISAPLSIMANIVNSKNKNKEQALLEGIVGNLDTAGSILMEQSFMQSLNEILTNNDGVVSGLVNQILQLPARAIPTFMKQLVDLTDSTQRTSYEYGKPVQSAINAIKAKIPGLSTTLAPSVDTMGREIKRHGGKNNIFNVFLNPANVSAENISTSAEEIYRLYQQTGDKTIMPRVAPYYINSKGQKITFTSKEKAEFQKISGGIVETSIQNLLDDDTYQSLSDTDKADVINNLVNYSYNKAQMDIAKTPASNRYKNVTKYVNSGGDPGYYYLHKKEIDYQIKNPNKYNYIKQITSYDNYQKYTTEIKNIREKYKNATTATRKAKTISYINSLDLSAVQKAMLIRKYYTSYNSYNSKIYNYVNQSDLSASEKLGVYKELGFKVKGGRVRW